MNSPIANMGNRVLYFPMKYFTQIIAATLFLSACSAQPALEPKQIEEEKHVDQENIMQSSSSSQDEIDMEEVAPEVEEEQVDASSSVGSSESLSDMADLHEMLIDTLHNEYRSHARYQAVLDKFDRPSPFPLVDEQSEEKILALQKVLEKYNLPIGKNPYLGHIIAPDRIVQACRKGKEGELETIALYEKFLPLVTDFTDVHTVFSKNAEMSRDTYIPLFNNCIENE